MKGEVLFLDTNVLVYAHDLDAGRKYRIARDRIEGFWRKDRPPSLSVQVLQELYVNLVRKNVSAKAARQTVEDYLEWPVVDNDRELLRGGLDECERWQLSTWDGLILAAARRAGAQVLWSEDFNSGQDYGGITVRNPFQKPE